VPRDVDGLDVGLLVEVGIEPRPAVQSEDVHDLESTLGGELQDVRRGPVALAVPARRPRPVAATAPERVEPRFDDTARADVG
jgi:hypothetical protein